MITRPVASTQSDIDRIERARAEKREAAGRAGGGMNDYYEISLPDSRVTKVLRWVGTATSSFAALLLLTFLNKFSDMSATLKQVQNTLDDTRTEMRQNINNLQDRVRNLEITMGQIQQRQSDTIENHK